MKAYDEDTGVRLLSARLDAPAQLSGGTNEVGVRATVELAAADVLGPTLRGLIDGDARIEIRGSLTGRTGAFTGFEIGVPVELRMRIVCDGECVLIDGDGTVTSLSNSTGGGDGNGDGDGDGTRASVGLLALSLLQPAAAQLDARARLNVTLPTDLYVGLPETALDLVWAADRAAASSAAAALSLSIEPCAIAAGRADAGVSARLSAASQPEGAALRAFARAVLVPEEAAPLKMFVRRDAAAASSSNECYAHRLFGELSPIELPTPLPSIGELLPPLSEGSDASGASGSDSSDAADDDDDDDDDDANALGISLESATLSLEGLNGTTLYAGALLTLGSRMALDGTLPRLELSVENASGAAMAALLLADTPLSMPDVRGSLSVTVEPAILALARVVTPMMRARPVDESGLAAELAGKTMGPIITATSPPGLSELRLPLEWIMSKDVAEAIFEAEDTSPGGGGGAVGEEGMLLTLDGFGFGTDLQMDDLDARAPSQIVTASLDASLSSLPLPDKLRVAVGAMEVDMAAAANGATPLLNMSLASLELRGGTGAPPAVVRLSSVLLLGETLSAADAGTLELASLDFVGSVDIGAVEAVGGRGAIEVRGSVVRSYADALGGDGPGGAGGGAGGGGRPSDGLSIVVGEAADCSGLSLAATLPLESAFDFRSAAFSLTVHNGSSPAGTLANVTVEPMAVAAGDAPVVRMTISLESYGRALVEEGVRRVVNDDDIDGAMDLCMVGGFGGGGDAAGDGAVRACVRDFLLDGAAGGNSSGGGASNASLERLTVLPNGEGRMNLTAWVAIAVPKDLELSLSLPAVSFDVVWGEDETDAITSQAAPVTVDVEEIVVQDGVGQVGVVIGVSAASDAEGASLRSLAHYFLVPETAAAPRLFLRKSASGSDCYVATLLDLITPLDLNFSMPSAAEVLNGSTPAGSADVGNAADEGGLLSLESATLAFEGLATKTAYFGAVATMRSNGWALDGALPPMELSVEGAGASTMAAFGTSEEPLSLPDVRVAMSVTIEPAILSLAKVVTPMLRERPIDRNSLDVELAGKTLGPAITPQSPPGLSQLRLPLEWVLSTSIAEVLFEEADDSGGADGGILLSVEGVGITAELETSALNARAASQTVSASLDATLSALPLPDKVRVAVGAMAVDARVGAGAAAAALLNVSFHPLDLRGGVDAPPVSPINLTSTIFVGATLDAADANGLELANLDFVGTVDIGAVAAVGGRGVIDVSGGVLQAYADALNGTDGGGADDALGAPPSGVTLNLSQPYVASCKGAIAELVLGTRAAVRVDVAALTMTVQNGSSVPLASVVVPATQFAIDDVARVRAEMALLDDGSVAIDEALQNIFDGAELQTSRLCLVGGTPQAPGSVRACLRLQEGSGDAADDNSYLSNASLDFLGEQGGDLAVPCVFGEGACAVQTMSALRSEPSAVLTAQATLPPISDAFDVTLGLPGLSVDVGYDGFERVAQVAFAQTTHVWPRGESRTLPVTLEVSDWYAIHRLLARDGRAAYPPFPLNTTVRVSGRATDASGAALAGCALPSFSKVVVPPSTAPNASDACLQLPRYLHSDPKRPDGTPLALVGSSSSSVELSVPFGVCNPLPLKVNVPQLSLTASFDGERVLEGTMSLASGGHLAAGANDTLLSAAVLHAGGPGQGSACVGSGLQPSMAESCVFSKLARSLTSYDATPLAVQATWTNALGASTTMRLGVTLFAAGAAQDEMRDASAAFAHRGTGYWGAQSLAREAAESFSEILSTIDVDIIDTLQSSLQTLFSGLGGTLASDSSVGATLEMSLFNVFTVPLALHNLRANANLSDIDGVDERGVGMAISTATHFDPDTDYNMVTDLTTDLALTSWAPGTTSPVFSLPISSTWEAVVRYLDEAYAKLEQCLKLYDLLVEVELNCDDGGDSGGSGGGGGGGGANGNCDGTTPMRTTLAISLPEIGTFKRRACHSPLTCTPTSATLLSGNRDDGNTRLSGDASLSSGSISLVGGGADSRGSAFHSTQVDLLHGFEMTFDFNMAKCPDTQTFDFSCFCMQTVACTGTTAGFALVLQAEAQDALGTDCTSEAQSFLPEADFGIGAIDNSTDLSCSAYDGVGKSFGLLFSSFKNRLYGISLLAGLSDWPRSGLGLYVNGDLRVTTHADAYGPARGVAQFGETDGLDSGTTHQARVVFHAAARMLYLYLDGESAPYLWAELQPDDLGLGADGLAWVGFTGTSGARSQGVTISNWEVKATATSVADSALLEEGEVVTSAGWEGFAHIDARDSCGLPRQTGGDSWSATLTKPSGGSASVAVTDLGDGTYRVPVLSQQSGTHTLEASLGGQQFTANFIVDP